ncbi:MAG: nucleotidyl transferase AbiEii/AbiGii toxin family protein [Patescibacteria group bacterium]
MVDIDLPHPKDAAHKAWLYRILSGVYDNAVLAKLLYFKGGTCAAMLGYLDRFSVDLDFDFAGARAALPDFFADLITFIENHITEQIINQDLNTLLPYERFSRIRKTLKQETLMFLRDEKKRIESR